MVLKGEKFITEIKLVFVDSFTDKKFFGNQAPVVINADNLTDKDKAIIARELNASETVFISQSSRADYKIQFFSPKQEVELCGHGTIAAYWVLSSVGEIPNSGNRVQITQETKVGILPVDIYFDDCGKPHKIMMHQTRPEFIGEYIDRELVARILNINPHSILDNYPVQNVSTGRAKLMIPLSSRELLYALQPDFDQMKDFCQKIRTNGFHVFTFDTHDKLSLTTARHFAPTAGVNEDPVTGNAAGALGCYVVKYCKDRIRQSDLYNFIMEQGFNLNRNGTLYVEILAGESITSVKVGGKARVLFETKICFDD